jgi:hypothetical protein
VWAINPQIAQKFDALRSASMNVFQSISKPTTGLQNGNFQKTLIRYPGDFQHHDYTPTNSEGVHCQHGWWLAISCESTIHGDS